MNLTIVTDDLYDGSSWVGPASLELVSGRVARVSPSLAPDGLRAAAVLPGLTDFGVRATGYQEPPFGHPFAPETAFAALCLAHGVTGVVDIASGAPVIAHLRGLSARDEGPRIAAALARLATEPTDRNDLTTSRDTVDATIASYYNAGADLASLGCLAPETAQLARDAARSAGLTVVETKDAAGKAPGLTATTPTGTSYTVPQIEARARWTVEGLVTVPGGHLAAPFLPYARHFANGDNPASRRIAKKRLRRIYPDRHPLPALDDTAIRRALLDGRCLASSGVGAAGLVPGLSLWRELEHLEQHDVPQPNLLHAATGAIRGALRQPIALGPGAPADLLLLGESGRGLDISSLRQAVAHVVVGGRVHARADLDATTTTLITDALEAR